MWSVYYGDGTVVTDRDCDPFWVPTTNVQIIWCEVSGVFSGILYSRDPSYCDCYWWDGQCWRTGDDAGLWQYLFTPGPQRIIYGATIADAEFQAIRDRAVLDRQRWRDGHS